MKHRLESIGLNRKRVNLSYVKVIQLTKDEKILQENITIVKVSAWYNFISAK